LNKEEYYKKFQKDKTAHNKQYTFRRPCGRLQGFSRLGHSASLHSHASFHPHFASPGLCFAKPLFGLAKRRILRTLNEIFYSDIFLTPCHPWHGNLIKNKSIFNLKKNEEIILE